MVGRYGRGPVTADDPVEPDTEAPAARAARSEGDDADERISLHGPTFEEVMAALLAVDPRKSDTDPSKGGDDGSKA